MKKWPVFYKRFFCSCVIDFCGCLARRLGLESRAMNGCLPLGQALGLSAVALLALGSAGCRVLSEADYPVGIYSVGSETNLADIAGAGFNLVTGPARRGFLDAA